MTSAFAANPEQLLQSETARIEGFPRGFHGFLALSGVLMAADFVLLFWVHRDWSMGLAIQLMALSAMAFCGDVMIHKRTIPCRAEITGQLSR